MKTPDGCWCIGSKQTCRAARLRGLIRGLQAYVKTVWSDASGAQDNGVVQTLFNGLVRGQNGPGGGSARTTHSACSIARLTPCGAVGGTYASNARGARAGVPQPEQNLVPGSTSMRHLEQTDMCWIAAAYGGGGAAIVRNCRPRDGGESGDGERAVNSDGFFVRGASTYNLFAQRIPLDAGVSKSAGMRGILAYLLLAAAWQLGGAAAAAGEGGVAGPPEIVMVNPLDGAVVTPGVIHFNYTISHCPPNTFITMVLDGEDALGEGSFFWYRPARRDRHSPRIPPVCFLTGTMQGKDIGHSVVEHRA